MILSVFISCTLVFLCCAGPVTASETFSDSFPELAGLDDFSFSDVNVGTLLVPVDSNVESDILAAQMLAMASAQSAQDTSDLFEANGFKVLGQFNYDKDTYDPSHTCAYTIGNGIVFKGLVPANAILVSIRGTSAGEWYSNFDFCLSRNEDTLFAENFLCAASECFLNLKDFIETDNSDQLILVCGHSRGAACANLLGVLLNEYIDPSRVYVYTSACPATIHDDSFSAEDSNIFNSINPADLIPMMPFEQWGFKRAGTDIILTGDAENNSYEAEGYVQIMTSLSPTIESYYNDRHAFDNAGLSDTGMTSFEIMLLLCTALIDLQERFSGNITDHEELPDLENIISDESDLSTLMDIYEELTANDYQKGIDLLIQHLPTTYLQLMGVTGSNALFFR